MPFPLFHATRATRATAAAALCATILFAGCGPEFFKAKGTINSDGGLLKQWSRTPVGCMRGDTMGEPGTILKFQFDLPPGFVAANPKGRNAPEELSIGQNGAGVIGSLKMMAPVRDSANPNNDVEPTNGFVLDNSNCKTISLDRQEQSKQFAESEKPLKGRLQLDCTVQGSHITADMTFKHCGM